MPATKRCLLVLLVVLLATVSRGSWAEDKLPSNQAELTLSGNKMVFKHLVAVGGEAYGEPRVMVLASGQKLSADVLAQVKEKSVGR